MKILVGMPSKDSWGGPISSEPPFVEALRQNGVEVHEETYVYGDKDRPTPFLERVRRVVKTAFRFRKCLKNGDFDLIHLNTAFDLKTILRDSFSLSVMSPGKTKVFLKLHGSEAENFVKTGFFMKILLNFLKKRVDGFGVHTKEEKANFLWLGFDPKKFYFVKNAVTIQNQLPENFHRPQQEKSGNFKILFVSRFIPAKGLLETIQACDLVRKSGFQFQLFAIGDGETREAAENLVNKLSLQNHVRFTGYISEAEVTRHFLDGDLFVFPTRHAEGFPNVLFKAVAAGLPIITTKIRAAKDYLREPENCLFCTQEPENIARKIIELIEDKTLREKMSEHNLCFGKTLLPEKIARDFLEIYEKICRNL
jgi:glycosyltransferase involved in cell wall biosynthesis